MMPTFATSNEEEEEKDDHNHLEKCCLHQIIFNLTTVENFKSNQILWVDLGVDRIADFDNHAREDAGSL